MTGVLALACGGDDDDEDTGNDTQTQSASETVGDDSGDGSASVTATTSATTTMSTSETTEDSGSESTTDDTATTSAGDSESGSSGPDGGSDSSSGDENTNDTGAVCSMDQESCANGEACCDGLDCCAGIPVPPGQEYCSAGPCPISDRNKKENFAAIDPHDVLARVVAMPITTWSYTFEGGVRHIGPMAQDFKAAFAVGATDKAIFQVDADGVALASVQALHEDLEVLQRENDELRARLAKLEAALAKRGGR